jgi:opine dehydrogenase
MKRRTIAVCGAGAAGTAIAADLALKGHDVRLYELPSFEGGIEGIREKSGIELTGDSLSSSGRTGFASLQAATTDAEEAVKGADAIMITVPALHHTAFFDAVLPYLQPGQFVLFNTGYWATLRFADRLKQEGLFDEVTLCETNIMPYLSQRMDDVRTKIFNSKRVMTLAAFPGDRTEKAFEVLTSTYSEYKAVPNVLWTNISSGGNWCIHVQLTLPIMGYVFDRFRGCKFYTEATEQFSRLSAAFDEERAPLAERLSCSPIETGTQWAKNAYGYEGKDLADAFRKSPHSDRYSPLSSLDRVLDEDLGYSFVPMVRLADQLGHSMPLTRGMIEVTGAMLSKDYWGMGLTLDDLGIRGMDAETLIRFVQTGESASRGAST